MESAPSRPGCVHQASSLQGHDNPLASAVLQATTADSWAPRHFAQQGIIVQVVMQRSHALLVPLEQRQAAHLLRIVQHVPLAMPATKQRQQSLRCLVALATSVLVEQRRQLRPQQHRVEECVHQVSIAELAPASELHVVRVSIAKTMQQLHLVPNVKPAIIVRKGQQNPTGGDALLVTTAVLVPTSSRHAQLVLTLKVRELQGQRPVSHVLLVTAASLQG